MANGAMIFKSSIDPAICVYLFIFRGSIRPRFHSTPEYYIEYPNLVEDFGKGIILTNKAKNDKNYSKIHEQGDPECIHFFQKRKSGKFVRVS